MIYNFLFPMGCNDSKVSLFLLAMRIVFGLLLMHHGLQKLMNFQELSQAFPDPIGVGTSVSLGLAVFAELFCSIGFLAGVLYRLALIPMIFTMFVIVFIVHGQQNFAAKELPIIYLSVFVLMYLVGPGKYSVDYWIGSKLKLASKKHD